MELDLVDYHQEHLNLIKKLHKSIGSFNDVYENKKLVESKLFKATDNEVKIIKSKLKEEKLILNNEIKKEVFAMRLLVSRSFY
jgi:hypothetical protein